MTISMDELEKNRREWVEITRKNGFREGIADLLAHQYSQRTHFIFELLQNSEDAHASCAKFQVNQNGVTFSHNGTRLFTKKNVESITSIGKSTKEHTDIGKHGIGFKAVFAYTHTPIIHSGDKHFVIEDVVCPRFLTPDQNSSDIDEQETRISLPFDTPELPAEKRFRELVPAELAVDEISVALKNLSIRTLLFLKRLDEISWSLPDGTSGTFLRETRPAASAENARYVDVTDGSATESWLIFHRNMAVGDEGKEDKTVTVEVAFLLEDNKVVRAQNTELVVYFPTEKTTELGFLIQGPFKTTKARDNIDQDSKSNRQMLEAAAQLAADSLETLRDMGHLNLSSYNALPLKYSLFRDNNTAFFLPVYNAVRNALKSKALLPKHGGGFVDAQSARLVRGAQLADVFSYDQLGALFGTEKLYWVETGITADRMPEFHSYLVGKRKSWPPKEWEQEPLAEGIELEAKHLAEKVTPEFFKAQSEDWLAGLYAYLKTNYTHFAKTPFLRLDSGEHVLPEKAFLPPSHANEITLSSFPLVKKSLADQPEIRAFLVDTAKLREPNRVDVIIECLLPKYHDGNLAFEESAYERDLQKIIESHAEANPDDARRLVAELKKTPFIACIPASGLSAEISWRCANDQALFKQSDDLKHWFSGNDQDAAWFAHEIADLNRAGKLLASSLGFTNASLLKRSPPSPYPYRRPEGGFDSKADIFGLDWVCQHPSVESALFLWQQLLENIKLIKGLEFTSTNQQFPKDKTKAYEGPSILGKKCIESAWLPCKNSPSFSKPSQLFMTDLPDEFEPTVPLAESLSRVLGMKQPEQQDALEILVPGDDRKKKLMQEIMSAPDSVLDKFEKLIPQEIPPQPAPPFKEALKSFGRPQGGQTANIATHTSSPVTNPPRYQGKLEEQILEGVTQHMSSPHKATFSPVRDQPSNFEARKFLYTQYQGHCQITGETFAKAKPNPEGNTENYFEACALTSYTDASYLNDPGNMLCVSADTMAKLKNASFEWGDDLEILINQWDQTSENASIRIRLAAEDLTITWTQRHFMHLIALWNRA